MRTHAAGLLVAGLIVWTAATGVLLAVQVVKLWKVNREKEER